MKTDRYMAGGHVRLVINMNVVFRTDASTQIGTGHVMRCLTLADELRTHGAGITFICREHSGNLCSYVEEKGFSVCRLSSAAPGSNSVLSWNSHAQWLGVSLEQDAEETASILKQLNHEINWLVVDHYALERNWEKRLRPLVQKIMVIDDLADRPHDCDVLLDQNLHEKMGDRYIDLVPETCRTFLGPRYALLRPEFFCARQRLRKRDGTIQRILVFFGGSDVTNETSKALRAIQKLQQPDIAVDVVIGPTNPHQSEVRRLSRTMKNVTCHFNVNNMAELMAKADLAIGAGGATSWERCCLGLPSLFLSIAENQTLGARTLGEHGIGLYLGGTRVSSQDIMTGLTTLINSPELCRHFSRAGMKIVDGVGLKRIVNKIICPVVHIREAVIDDSKEIYAWRNSPVVRRFFFDSSPISFDDHDKWFREAVDNHNRVLFIGEINKRKIGVVRYDINKGQATVSIFLDPGKIGQSYGAILLHASDCMLRRLRPEVLRLKAKILQQNEASRKIFETTGYAVDHCVYVRSF